MTTQETAQKYGVPTPETCKELDWQHDSIFYWCLGKIGWFIATEPNTNEFVPAPQMHEIAHLLPEKYLRHRVTDRELIYDGRGVVWTLEIQQHHYAEAYAQMYIKLKAANLL